MFGLAALRKLSLPTPFSARRNCERQGNTWEEGDAAPLSEEAERARLQGLVQAVRACGEQGAEASELEAVSELRRALSAQLGPPIQAIIDFGGVQVLLQRLVHGSPAVQLEAAWALANVASGTSAQTKFLVDNGAVETMFDVLLSPAVKQRAELCDHCLWALGNIAGDGVVLRDYLIRAGVVGVLGQLWAQIPSFPWHSNSRTQVLRSLTWLMSSLCRGSPSPALDEVECAFDYFGQVLQGTDDVQMLCDALWGLCYLIEGGKSTIGDDAEQVARAKRMLSADEAPAPPGQQPVLKRIVACARIALDATGNQTTVPALRLLGVLVSLSSADFTDAALAAGALRVLRGALEDHRMPAVVRRDVAWTLANIAAGTSAQAQQLLIGDTCRAAWDALVLEARDAPREVLLEAAWAFVNLAKGGKTMLQHMDPAHVFGLVVPALRAKPDSTLQCALLDASDAVLRHGAEHMLAKAGRCTVRVVAENSGLPKVLEELQQCDDELVSKKATCLLSTWFGTDNDRRYSSPERATEKEKLLKRTSTNPDTPSKTPRQSRKFGA